MTNKEVTTRMEEIIDFSGRKYIDTPLVKRYSSRYMYTPGLVVAAHFIDGYSCSG